MAIILPACNTNELEARTPASSGNVTTKEVSDNTNKLIGQTVTVRSEPIKKIGTNTFTISDEQLFGTEPILVVNFKSEPA